MGNELTEQPVAFSGVHLVVKPIGPVCNLDCTYCFYTEKQALFPQQEQYRMSDEVLRAFVSKYIDAQPFAEVEFVWQGGEPTLLGLEFYQKVIKLQEQYRGIKSIHNSLQTNGTLLDDKWCEFLSRHSFLVGLSLDGPQEIHDLYRITSGKSPSFDRVMRGLDLLKKHKVEFNVLACVARETARKPLEVYHFLKAQGVEFIQFIPIVERQPDSRAQQLGLRLGAPPVLDNEEASPGVTPWTVEPEAYGDFLNQVFDEWVRQDVGRVFVMNFEWALNSWVGNPSPICFFSQRCGRSLAIEHNGDVYSCDHYVYPHYRLGNILTDDLERLATSPAQNAFGAAKEISLPRYCRECDVLFACRGECPKHRFIRSPHDEPGLNYLCRGYKKHLGHIDKYMKEMAQLLAHNLPASDVMKVAQGAARSSS